MQMHEILKLEESKVVYNFFEKDVQMWVCVFDTKVKFSEKEKILVLNRDKIRNR